MRTLRIPRRTAALPLAVLLACGGGSGGDVVTPPMQTRILVVGLARQDLSPVQSLEGFLVFFYDLDRQQLLSARPMVNGFALQDSLEPGIIPGWIYAKGANVRSELEYRLSAKVFTPEGERDISSTAVRTPAPFQVQVPETAPADQPLTVRWDPITDAEKINVSLGSHFETDVDPSTTSLTIPASAVKGVPPGTPLEVEVTAYNVFYVSIAGGINSLQDAEAFAQRFNDVDNVDGATGAFGGATTVGAVVTIQ